VHNVIKALFKRKMSKTFIDGTVGREFKLEVLAAKESIIYYFKEVLSVCSREQSIFRCASKVVMAMEHMVTGDRKRKTAGAMMLKALEWKLVLVTS